MTGIKSLVDKLAPAPSPCAVEGRDGSEFQTVFCSHTHILTLAASLGTSKEGVFEQQWKDVATIYKTLKHKQLSLLFIKTVRDTEGWGESCRENRHCALVVVQGRRWLFPREASGNAQRGL